MRRICLLALCVLVIGVGVSEAQVRPWGVSASFPGSVCENGFDCRGAFELPGPNLPTVAAETFGPPAGNVVFETFTPPTCRVLNKSTTPFTFVSTPSLTATFTTAPGTTYIAYHFTTSMFCQNPATGDNAIGTVLKAYVQQDENGDGTIDDGTDDTIVYFSGLTSTFLPWLFTSQTDLTGEIKAVGRNGYVKASPNKLTKVTMEFSTGLLKGANNVIESCGENLRVDY